MSALPAAQVDTLLRRYESPRRGIRRVQATADTVELLKLAGFRMPPVFSWYDVPVRVRQGTRNLLEVDVPCPGKGEPMQAVPLDRWRVEMRIDDTWLTTLIVDAKDEHAAGFVALDLCLKKDPSLSYDVWDVTKEENLAVDVESTAGVDPGSSVSPASRGGERGTALDPGIARHSSPAFAALERYALAQGVTLGIANSERSECGDPRTRSLFVPGCETGGGEFPSFELVYLAAVTGVESFTFPVPGDIVTFQVYEKEGEGREVRLPVRHLAALGADPHKAFMGRYRLDLQLTPIPDGEPMDFAPRSPRGETSASPRGENKKVPRCPVCDSLPTGVVEYDGGASRHYWSCSCPKRARVVAPTDIASGHPPRWFRVRIADDVMIDVELRGLVNTALPAMLEGEDWEPTTLSDADVSSAFAALHRCRALADFEVKLA